MPHNASTTLSEKPLSGAVLCCTSILPEIRTRLTEYAEQMGAEHRLDLTSDVTHLLVGETGTPKYQYVAREREDVKVLRPEWVEAVREAWTAHKKLDIHALDVEYKLPTLAGLKICITGFDDLNFRAQLQEDIKKNGGMYTGDLTKDVTHLIAASPEGKKYEYASLWQKRIVSLKWYKDTLARGMQLDESLYDPGKPMDEQGVGAWNRQSEKTATIGKRRRNDVVPHETSRKLRRTASARFGSQNETLWTDIVAAPQPEIQGGEHENLRPSKSMPVMRSSSDLGRNTHDSINSKTVNYSTNSNMSTKFFEGSHFVLNGFDSKRRDILERAILSHGAVLHENVPNLLKTDDINPSRRFLLVPHQFRRQNLSEITSVEQEITIVNELWVEKCMTLKQVLLVADYPLGGIINHIQSPDIAQLLVNVTGFPDIETMHVSKVITSLGAKYGEVFTPEHSVLVFDPANANNQKVLHAVQWKVPIVKKQWLWDLLSSGKIPPFGPFLIRGQSQPEDAFRQRSSNPKGASKQKNPSPLPDPSFHTQDTMPVTSKSEIEPTPSTLSSQNKQDFGTANKTSDTTTMPLNEVSGNVSPRKLSPPHLGQKKKLFRTFDGSGSMDYEEGESAKEDRSLHVADDPDVIASNQGQDPIAEFLQIKAQAAARALEAGKPVSKQSSQKRLLGRALSNLSNASIASKSARHSRASSVDTMNTDGLGTELSNSAAPDFSNQGREESSGKTSFSLTGRAKSTRINTDAPSGQYPYSRVVQAIDINDPNLLRDEYAEADLAPQRTQLGYEESEEAMALREKLAEKRRARGRLGQKDGDPEPELPRREREQQQKEKRGVIRDDDALLGRGRRTRQTGKVMHDAFAMNNELAL